ncbi:hypothetical protein F5Y04DRAFT_286772 [Hypomontagnella monticulosa]|nr:hypothetical protein F5Y04DRAFT_286772 [Hypomontagnella monticulosa]
MSLPTISPWLKWEWQEIVDSSHYCEQCGLRYLNPPSGFQTVQNHPSHTMPDGQRCLVAALRPYKFSRNLNHIECDAVFAFSPVHPHNWSVSYKCKSRPDDMNADSNLDNATIAAMTQMLCYVRDEIIPYRQRLVRDIPVQAWNDQFIIWTPLGEPILKLLLRAEKLQFSKSRQALVRRNVVGVVTEKHPVTSERRYHIASFVRLMRHLGRMGAQVHWRSRSDERCGKARRAFMNQPIDLTRAQNLKPQVGGYDGGQHRGILRVEEIEEMEENWPADDLIESDDYDDPPDIHDFDASLEELPTDMNLFRP